MDAHSKSKPAVFTNLFRKAANQQCNDAKGTKEKGSVGRKKLKKNKDNDKVEKEQKRRKKGEDLTKTSQQEKKKSVNLSCTSLILFDEVRHLIYRIAQSFVCLTYFNSFSRLVSF